VGESAITNSPIRQFTKFSVIKQKQQVGAAALGALEQGLLR
jgi:hypothetical protein